MSDRLILQKLLTSQLATAIVEVGAEQVGGYVAAAAGTASLLTPQQLLAAYGVNEAPQFVDVVRFEQPRLASLTTPKSASRPWPTFPNGFLFGDSLSQVWVISRTRYPLGAEYWRIRFDDEQKVLSRYEGVARGWANAKQWRPPSPMVGTLALWRGHEYFADVSQDTVHLTAITDHGPQGFQPVRPQVWAAVAPLNDTELFERVFTAELDGVPVRILRTSGPTADILLLDDDPESAGRVGAGLIEPGIFEMTVYTERLTNIQGVENMLAQSRATGATQTVEQAQMRTALYLTIDSVDWDQSGGGLPYAVPELQIQLPITGKVIRQIPGPDRSDYFFVRLEKPIKFHPGAGFDWTRTQSEFRGQDQDGSFLWIYAGVVCSLFTGTQLHAGMRQLPVRLALVVDNTLGRDETLSFEEVRVRGTRHREPRSRVEYPGLLIECWSSAEEPEATPMEIPARLQR